MSDPIRGRAAEKAQARERDEDRLRRGEISPQDLQRENLMFCRFQKGVVGFGPKLKPKDVDFVFVEPKS